MVYNMTMFENFEKSLNFRVGIFAAYKNGWGKRRILEDIT